jgi:hypothetical protein
MEMAAFHQEMDPKGWALFPAVLPQGQVESLRADLEEAYRVCRRVQEENGVAQQTDGTVHHVLHLADGFVSFIEGLPLVDYLTEYFGGKFILNSYGGVLNLPQEPSYVSNIHRDVRVFSREIPLMINMLVMLDDFTLENGATYLLSGSHRIPDRPEASVFFSQADRITGLAGSILLFNSNVWHCAGQNTTGAQRRALTLTFTKPFIKQQLDYPRVLPAERVAAASEQFRQIIGYKSRVPASLEEWYQPPERRFYQPDQH